MNYNPEITNYVPLEYEKLDQVIEGIDMIAGAIGYEEDILDALEAHPTLFDADEIGYLRGEYLERMRTD